LTSNGQDLSYFDVPTPPSNNCCGFPSRSILSGNSLGSFAAVSNGAFLGVVSQLGEAITAEQVDLDAGSPSAPVTISATGDQALGPVAAATCGTHFEFAFAVIGGKSPARRSSPILERPR
jgi:hypothetical protein